MNASFTDRTIQAAARWYARLQAPDCTQADREEFARWCAADPKHAAAYAAARDMCARLTRLAHSDPRLRALTDAAFAARCVHSPAQRLRRRLGVAAALAASVVAVFGAARMLHTVPESAPADTMALVATSGATRMLTLDDGSVVHVDVSSELEIHFTAREREVRLQRGRALFDVAHDPARPFTVVAGGGRVTAVGTRFQVERGPAELVVTLAEGIVTVAATESQAERSERLVPGEQLSISADDSGWSKRTVDARAATSWSTGRLVFREARLDDALQQVNRYAATKVRLADASLADLPVSGNFVAGDSEAAVAAFAAVLPLEISGADDELLLYRAHGERR
jgi:transmembrane sensor